MSPRRRRGLAANPVLVGSVTVVVVLVAGTIPVPRLVRTVLVASIGSALVGGIIFVNRLGLMLQWW